jgi:hypothetical protein
MQQKMMPEVFMAESRDGWHQLAALPVAIWGRRALLEVRAGDWVEVR